MYDNNGDTFGFTYNGTDYYYIKNAQNDVTAIADTTGEIVCRYYYDAWGKILSIKDGNGNVLTDTDTLHIGNINPIRYRSYYFDSEINMYYLNSRYYSPDLCRFLNVDSYISTGQGILSNNMFSYCLNSPVNMIDSNGSRPSAFPNPFRHRGEPIPSWNSRGMLPSNSGGGKSSSTSNSTSSTKNKGSSNFLKNVNAELATEEANIIFSKSLNAIKYKPYIQSLSPLEYSNTAIKNITNLANNVVYSLSSSDLKIVGNTVGIGTVIAFGVDVVNDYNRYGGCDKDYYTALSITTGFAIVCIGVGLMCTGIGAPAGATLIACSSTGVVTGICSEVWKKYFIGY